MNREDRRKLKKAHRPNCINCNNASFGGDYKVCKDHWPKGGTNV